MAAAYYNHPSNLLQLRNDCLTGGNPGCVECAGDRGAKAGKAVPCPPRWEAMDRAKAKAGNQSSARWKSPSPPRKAANLLAILSVPINPQRTGCMVNGHFGSPARKAIPDPSDPSDPSDPTDPTDPTDPVLFLPRLPDHHFLPCLPGVLLVVHHQRPRQHLHQMPEEPHRNRPRQIERVL